MADPAPLENVEIEVRLPVLLDAEHRRGVEEAVHDCPIQNALLHPPKITIDVEDGAVVEWAA